MDIIPKVDLRGVEPGVPGWEEARAAVTASMVAHGYVVVAYNDALGPELWQVLFGHDLPELFALPLETKQRNVSAKAHFRGYIATAEPVYESVSFDGATDEGSIRDFTNLFWPQGNPEFR
jgi:isopenicillin N synthase-like dioxygenase